MVVASRVERMMVVVRVGGGVDVMCVMSFDIFLMSTCPVRRASVIHEAVTRKI